MRIGSIYVSFVAMSLSLGVAACFASDEKESLRAEPGMEVQSVLAENHCARMPEWIEQHRNRLPSTYDELSALPVECRKYIYITLSPIQQSALWRTQFKRYREQHSSMTAEQRRVLQHATDLLSPELFAVPRDTPEWSRLVGAPIHDLEMEARSAFGDEEAGLLLAQIGPSDAGSNARHGTSSDGQKIQR